MRNPIQTLCGSGSHPDGDCVPGGAAGAELPAREGRGAQGHQVGQRTAHNEGRRQDNR